MDLSRIWRVLTAGERLVVVISAVLLALLLVGGGIVLGVTPFQAAQTTPGGGTVVDTDGDGLSDDNEALLFGTDPNEADTDGDGMPDGWEARHAQTDPLTGLLTPDPARNDSEEDPDDDGLSNLGEFQAGTLPWTSDTDGDGLLDGWELRSDHDPLDPSTPGLDADGDGLTAEREHELGTLDNAVDSDRDGLTDREEIRGTLTLGGETYSFDPTDPAKRSTGGSGLADGFAVVYDLDPSDPNVGRADHDEDGLTTATEARLSLDRFEDTRTALIEGLNPMDPDSDGDGLPDGWEVTHGLDPLDAADGEGDPDDDGLTNGEEFFWNTDPLEPDTDGDSLADGEEVNGWEVELKGRTQRVTSNPLLADSDGDGLTDAEERDGQAVIDGETVTFCPPEQYPDKGPCPTHPLLPDTDGDGLVDREEVARSFGGQRLDPTARDTDADGLIDGDEVAYWDERMAEAAESFPEALEAREDGECASDARSAIQAQDPSILGPGGDADGDCTPNVLDPDSDRLPGESLPPGTDPRLDGQEVEPGQRQGRELPASDPAIADTDGDGLPDEWELRWARFATDVDGAPTWLFDPTKADSDADGTLDGADDDEGQVADTVSCWGDLPDVDDPAIDAHGDSVPWLARTFTNEDEMRQGTDPYRCDSDDDGLMDGWETQYSGHPAIDPRTSPESWWTGAVRATACYPGQTSVPALSTVDNLGLARLSGFGTAPDVGPVTSEPDDGMRPTGDPGDLHAFALQNTGCNWEPSGDGTIPRQATRGQADCPDCAIIGIVATLELQQWYKLNPTSGNADFDQGNPDGAPDVWELLWHQVAPGDQKDRVRPHANDADADGDGASLEQEFREGSSPLTPDTDGDGEIDGPDDNPLSATGGLVQIRDGDNDHLLDASSDQCPDGTVTMDPSNQAERIQAARSFKIVEIEENTFLCEPFSDQDGRSTDADGDGVPDAWELIWTYTRTGSASVGALNDPQGDQDGDGITDLAEYRLGRPESWPDDQVWWFGSDPFTANGLDADGDGLQEGLLVDSQPFETLPREPAPDTAWTTACDVGIVCPSEDPFAWTEDTVDSSLDVAIESIGEADGSDRRISKTGEDLTISVQVDDVGGNPVADMPVAILALSSTEAQSLTDGDRSLLAQPSRVLCIVKTGSNGHVTGDGCSVESGATSADLSNTGRDWLGSTTPEWTRDLAVLDPTASAAQQGSPENQPRIVAWAMGTGTDPGTSDQHPVLVASEATLEPVDIPARAASGSEIEPTVRVTDAGGDPLSQGTLTATLGDAERSVELSGEPQVTLDPIPLPEVTTATDRTLTFDYRLTPATYVPQASTETTVRVLPVPDLLVDVPGNATANRTVPATVTLQGPQGEPVQGPVSVELGSSNATATTDANGEAEMTLAIPADVSPGTSTVLASFEGTDAYGPATREQQITIRQRLAIAVTPGQAFLGDETTFTVTVGDLADRAPTVQTNVTLRLGSQSANAELAPREDLASVRLPVDAPIGTADLTVLVRAARDARYEPLEQTVPIEVLSSPVVQIRPDRVPRGQTTNLTLNVTDTLGRPAPEATLDASWASGEATATITDGQGTLAFETPPDAPPEPVRITYEIDGPGLLPTTRTHDVGVLVGTNLTADLELDALSGLVRVTFTLTDDRGTPLPGASVALNWPLGDPVEVQANAEGQGQASLLVPPDASPGDVPVQVSYEGDESHEPATRILTAPVRSPTRIQTSDEIIWSEGSTLRITGRVLGGEAGQSVELPVSAEAGSRTLASTSSPSSPFTITVDPDTLQEVAGDARRFTLTLVTEGDDEYAPAETTVLVNRLVPVSLTTGVDESGDRVTVRVQASTPQGPLAGQTVSIGQQNGPSVQVQLDSDGQASVTLEDPEGTLVARYQGDDTHAPAQAEINLAGPAAPASTDVAWLLVGAVVLLIAIDIWIIVRVIRRLQTARQVEEVLKELEDQLMIGDEVQAAIYHAYLQLKATAQVVGAPEEETETVREFGERFVDNLELDREPVMGLIGIFEQAWYGEVHTGLRTEALTELRTIREHLREKGLVA